MFMEYTLDNLSGTYKFYDPTTNAMIIRNSVLWINFKLWEAEKLEEAIGNF